MRPQSLSPTMLTHLFPPFSGFFPPGPGEGRYSPAGSRAAVRFLVLKVLNSFGLCWLSKFVSSFFFFPRSLCGLGLRSSPAYRSRMHYSCAPPLTI